MPSPGAAQPVRDAKPLPWPEGEAIAKTGALRWRKAAPGTLMPRRPDERQTEARHVGGGLEAGLGTRSFQLVT